MKGVTDRKMVDYSKQIIKKEELWIQWTALTSKRYADVLL